jgi:hypothetical protein
MLFTDFGQVSRQRKLDLMDDSKDKRHDGALGMVSALRGAIISTRH